MSNIVNYINKYGNLTFDELKLNELDELIFGVLSYVDFDGILENNKYEKVKLSDAADMLFKKYKMKELMDNMSGVTAAIKIFDYIKNENRYKDLYLYNYAYKCDSNKQFSALFIDINEKLTYISFEGTDDLVSGWKEDCEMTYNFPIPAQKEAIKYVNRSIPLFTNRSYILGGHSKGGNLACVAAMYINPLLRSRIKRVVSYDGPGLKPEQLESKNYKNVESKLELVVPNTSIIGMLLNHKKEFKVVSSTKGGIAGHNVINWETEDTKFVASKLSKGSKKIDDLVYEWLNKYTDEELERFVTEIFDVLARAGVHSLREIKLKNIPVLLKIVEETKKLDEETRKIIKSLLQLVFDYYRNESK